MKTTYPCLKKKTDAEKNLDLLHYQYVLVPADKAYENIAIVCKANYINCIL